MNPVNQDELDYPNCKPGCGWYDCAYCRDSRYSMVFRTPRTKWKRMEDLYGPMHLQPMPGGKYADMVKVERQERDIQEYLG